MKLSFWIIIISAIVLTSCKKEDTEEPTIKNLEIGENNNEILMVEEDAKIEFTARDNEELSYYDLHIFRKTDSRGDSPSDNDWEYSEQISFTEETEENVSVPGVNPPSSTTYGFYLFKLKIFDKSGNMHFHSDTVYVTN